MVSLEKLKDAFQKCTEAPKGSLALWKSRLALWKAAGRTELRLVFRGACEEAEKRREFCFDRCPDPTDKKIVLELRHRIRAPDHAEWPLPRDLATRAMFSESA